MWSQEQVLGGFSSEVFREKVDACGSTKVLRIDAPFSYLLKVRLVAQ